jgi:hypothetical protein
MICHNNTIRVTRILNRAARRTTVINETRSQRNPVKKRFSEGVPTAGKREERVIDLPLIDLWTCDDQ